MNAHLSKTLAVLSLAISATFFSCAQSPNTAKHPDMKLIDSATEIKDGKKNYSLYYRKLLYQNQLKQYKDALITSRLMLQLRPNDDETVFIVGQAYERSGDTASAFKYYKGSLALCDKKLQMMDTKNRSFKETKTERALILMLLGREKESQEILTELLKNETDLAGQDEFRQLINMDRRDLLYGKEYTTEESADPIKKR